MTDTVEEVSADVGKVETDAAAVEQKIEVSVSSAKPWVIAHAVWVAAIVGVVVGFVLGKHF